MAKRQQRNSARSSILAGFVLMGAFTPKPAQAADWQVRRATTSGACSIQRSDSLPTLGVLLETRSTEKAACEAARDLKSDDFGETNKCQTYTPNTVTFCRNRNVTLSP